MLTLKEKYTIALRHIILNNSEEINQQSKMTFYINPIPINFNVKLQNGQTSFRKYHFRGSSEGFVFLHANYLYFFEIQKIYQFYAFKFVLSCKCINVIVYYIHEDITTKISLENRNVCGYLALGSYKSLCR